MEISSHPNILKNVYIFRVAYISVAGLRVALGRDTAHSLGVGSESRSKKKVPHNKTNNAFHFIVSVS